MEGQHFYMCYSKIGLRSVAHMKYYLHNCLAELSSSFVFFYQQTQNYPVYLLKLPITAGNFGLLPYSVTQKSKY